MQVTCSVELIPTLMVYQARYIMSGWDDAEVEDM